MLYALGVGPLGLDPVDEQHLAFVYESSVKVAPPHGGGDRLSRLLLGSGGWTPATTGSKGGGGRAQLVLHRPLWPSGTGYDPQRASST